MYDFDQTTGIGEAFAERLISEGCFVIVTGRRKENLDRFIARHGSDKAQAIAFDIAQLDRIPGFVQDITNDHPDLDCAILNAGIQRRCGAYGNMDEHPLLIQWTRLE